MDHYRSDHSLHIGYLFGGVFAVWLTFVQSEEGQCWCGVSNAITGEWKSSVLIGSILPSATSHAMVIFILVHTTNIPLLVSLVCTYVGSTGTSGLWNAPWIEGDR